MSSDLSHLDGTLCRITSSGKDLINNVRIVKMPDSDPFYRLVIIRPNEDDELSEKSSDISSVDDLCDVKYSPKIIEKEKNIDTKKDQLDKSNETKINVNNRRQNCYNRSQMHHKKRNRYFNRKNKNFRKIAQNCKAISSMEETYNYGNSDFNSTINHPVPYEPIQHSSDSMSPWITPPAMLNYSCQSFTFPVLPEKPRNSVGLLGDRPLYVPPLTNFQSNKQNDNYIHDQSLSYSPLASNFQANSKSDNFICDQTSPYPPMAPNFAPKNHSFHHNKQNSSYSQIASNYSSNEQTDNFTHNQSYWNNYSNYSKNNQPGNKKRSSEQSRNEWYNQRRRPNIRNNSSRKNLGEFHCNRPTDNFYS